MKRRRDFAQIAKPVVDIATGTNPKNAPTKGERVVKGGKRARKLAPTERSAMARKAARKRWEDR